MQRSIKNLMLSSWIITILLLSAVFMFFFTFQKRAEFHNRSEAMRKNSIKASRYRLAQVVNDAISFFNFELDFNGSTDAQKQEKIVDLMKKVRFFDNENGSLFIIDKSGKVISHPDNKKIGTNLKDITDVHGCKPYAYILDKLSEKGIYYNYKGYDQVNFTYYQVLTYAKFYSKWNWLVCSEISLDPLEKEIIIEKQMLKESLIKDICMMGGIALVITIIAITLSIQFSNSLNKQINKLLSFFKNPSTTENPICEEDFEFTELKFIGKSSYDMAEKILDLNDELAETLERTKALALEAESANQSKSCFFANISHELRSKMNGIMGMTDLLTNTKVSHEQQDYISSILVSCNSMMELVKDIGDFSTLETGKMALTKMPFSLQDCFNDIVKVFTEKAELKELKFQAELTPVTPPFITGDQNRIKQVISHLLENAIRFTTLGSIHFSAGTEKNDEGKMRLIVKIKDTGLGISEEKLERLFDFAQDTKQASRKFSGVSLGLAVSKEMVSLMSGEIRAESTKDAGTTFTVTIPVEQATEEDVVAAAKQSDDHDIPMQTTEIIRTRNIKVLLAEDDTINQSVTKLYLTRFGCSVDIANNGKEALDKFKANDDYDIIFMDCEMPEMDGFSAVRAIRKLEAGDKHIPIIALTAHALKGDRTMCLTTGMDEHIVKPIDVKTIKEILNKYFQETGLESEVKN